MPLWELQQTFTFNFFWGQNFFFRPSLSASCTTKLRRTYMSSSSVVCSCLTTKSITLASPKYVGNYRAKIYIGIKYQLEGSPIHHHIHKRTHRLTGEKGENDGDSGLDVIV